MAASTVKVRGRHGAQSTVATNGKQIVLQTSDKCPRCGDKGHVVSDHDDTRANQCSKCACVAQDVDSQN